MQYDSKLDKVVAAVCVIVLTELAILIYIAWVVCSFYFDSNTMSKYYIQLEAVFGMSGLEHLSGQTTEGWFLHVSAMEVEYVCRRRLTSLILLNLNIYD